MVDLVRTVLAYPDWLVLTSCVLAMIVVHAMAAWIVIVDRRARGR
jgi:hypothetical protein